MVAVQYVQHGMPTTTTAIAIAFESSSTASKPGGLVWQEESRVISITGEVEPVSTSAVTLAAAKTSAALLKTDGESFPKRIG